MSRMAAKPDSLSDVRRENFRAYCRRKGWQNEGGRWATTAISNAVGKPINKVSDLLNGKGSFGASIARDIEAAAGDLHAGELDGLGNGDSPFVEVRRVAVKFSNGHGQVVDREDDGPPLSFRSDYLRKLQIPHKKAVVVAADGDSNYPKIVNGAVVLINIADRDRLNGEFFAFRADGELLIKRLTRMPDGKILATAENSDFKPKLKIYDEKVDDFEVIGRAVWTGVEL